MKHGMPIASPRQRIGLLGGSFDPPHAGHLHITHEALKRFGLDRVWWLVSPGNPLKADGPAPLARRLEACRKLTKFHPRIVVSDLEDRFSTRTTAQMLSRLLPLYPGVRFTWLMGADNLVQFNQWDRWRDIAMQVPIGVLARPENVLRAGLSHTATTFSRARLPVYAARLLPRAQAPAWCLVTGAMVDVSSTRIRNSGGWTR